MDSIIWHEEWISLIFIFVINYGIIKASNIILWNYSIQYIKGSDLHEKNKTN